MATANYQTSQTEPLDEAKESGNLATDEQVSHAAAESLRAGEVEATEREPLFLSRRELNVLNIDDLRALANSLDIPDREQITEKEELIEALLKVSQA